VVKSIISKSGELLLPVITLLAMSNLKQNPRSRSASSYHKATRHLTPGLNFLIKMHYVLSPAVFYSVIKEHALTPL